MKKNALPLFIVMCLLVSQIPAQPAARDFSALTQQQLNQIPVDELRIVTHEQASSYLDQFRKKPIINPTARELALFKKIHPNVDTQRLGVPGLRIAPGYIGLLGLPASTLNSEIYFVQQPSAQITLGKLGSKFVLQNGKQLVAGRLELISPTMAKLTPIDSLSATLKQGPFTMETKKVDIIASKEKCNQGATCVTIGDNNEVAAVIANKFLMRSEPYSGGSIFVTITDQGEFVYIYGENRMVKVPPGSYARLVGGIPEQKITFQTQDLETGIVPNGDIMMKGETVGKIIPLAPKKPWNPFEGRDSP